MKRGLEKLRASCAGMRQAALADGISPSDPFGRWVEASYLAAEGLAEVVEDQSSQMMVDLRISMEAQVERGRQALASAEQLTRQLEERAKIAGAIAARTHETTAADLVNQIAQGNAEAMHKTLREEWIFAETKFHKRQLIRMGFMISLICIGMWGFGYAVAWSEGASARSVLHHCLNAPIYDKDKALWCRWDASELK